jgi:hypothetical protein
VTSVEGLIFCTRLTPSFGDVKSSAEIRQVRHYLTCKTAAFCPKVYYLLRRFSQSFAIIFLNGINRAAFVMETGCVLCEVRTKL